MAAATDPLKLRQDAVRLLEAGSYAQAMRACQSGMAAVANPHRRDALFLPLADAIALRAAEAGDASVGFAGRELLVRPADPETAWLGLPAPPEPGDTAPAGAPGAPLLLGAPVASRGKNSAAAGRHARAPLRFRSLEEAVEAAADGDVITLLPGTHNVRAPAGLALARRVLIRGSGHSGSGDSRGSSSSAAGAPEGLVSVVDYRGNSPLFRISRPCVLEGFEVDMVGFAPAIIVTAAPASIAAPVRGLSQPSSRGAAGGSSTAASSNGAAQLLRGVKVACSGDDAVDAGGAAAVALVGCTLLARKAGLRLYDRARATLLRCALGGCGAQAALLQERSRAELDGCAISGCSEEGVAATGGARADLRNCTLEACGGPAVDVSGSARAVLSGCRVSGCAGGAWAWDAARISLGACEVVGCSSYAVLVDKDAAVADSSSANGANEITGTAYVEAPKGAAPCWDAGAEPGGSDEVVRPGMLPRSAKAAAAAFPPDMEPFVFVPPMFV